MIYNIEKVHRVLVSEYVKESVISPPVYAAVRLQSTEMLLVMLIVSKQNLSKGILQPETLFPMMHR